MITGKIHETQLKGLASTLSDYNCPDGELQVCHNMLNDGAGLKPVEDVKLLSDFESNCELRYVHHTGAGDTVYIFNRISSEGERKGSYWVVDGDSTFHSLDYSVNDAQIASVGNILIIGSEDTALHYFLWKSKTYKYLGIYPPDLELEFMLYYKATTANADYEATEISDWIDAGSTEEGEDEWDNIGTQNYVMADFNKILEKCKENTQFLSPFYVRYAYELYDGTYMYQSSPVLMVPDSGFNPHIFYNVYNWNGITTGHYCYRIYYRPCRLCCRASNIADFGDWSDLISSVKVFVTPEITPYSLTGERLDYDLWGEDVKKTHFMGGTFAIGEDTPDDTTAAFRGDVDTFFTKDNADGYYYGGTYEREDKYDAGEDYYNFYLLKSYGTDDEDLLSGSWCEIDNVNLSYLQTSEQLPDGSGQRSLLCPSVMNIYNGRLNLANVRAKEKSTFPVGIISSFVAGETSGLAEVYINDNGNWVKTVASFSTGKWGDVSSMPGYFFYPNPNAKYLHLIINPANSSSTVTVLSVEYWMKLKQHPFLNGAYYFNGYYGFTSQGMPDGIPEEMSEFLAYPNVIYTSEADNPFTFPSANKNSVGTGDIVAINMATKAMSEGTAFGVNPLYAFCTDGIWALEVGGTGVFSAKQPVSRERLLDDDPEAMAKAESSILFLSERGLMVLEGGETRLLSGALQSLHNTIDAAALPHWTDINAKFGGQEYLEADDFMPYTHGAKMAFDYKNYRVWVFKPVFDYGTGKAVEGSGTAYVYDIRSQMWGTVKSYIAGAVDDGLDCYLNMAFPDENNWETAVFEKDTDKVIEDGKGFYLTRPLKLDAPDTMKTVRTLIERGAWQRGATKYLALWGSRDLRTWALVGAVEGCRMPRLSGTPYKHFIVGGWAQMTVGGDVTNRLTMDVKEKYEDKIR